MAVELSLIGRGGDFLGPHTDVTSNIIDYSAQEDSTPTIPGDSSGGVGALTFGANAGPHSATLFGAEFELSDSAYGTMRAIISQFTDTDGELSVDALNLLAKLTVTRTALPFHGTLSELFVYYFGLCGITSGYVIDPSFNNVSLALPAYLGDVWTLLKEVCVPYGAEMTLVSGNIYVRPLRTITAQNEHNTGVAQTTSIDGLAASVEVYYYNNEWIDNEVIYQPDESSSTLSVEANETAVESLQTNVSLTAVAQPIAIPEDGWHSNLEGGGYVVYGANGAVSPASWTSRGGRVTAEIDPDDNTKVNVTVYGANGPDAPYRLVTLLPNPDLDGDLDGEIAAPPERSSLRLVGTGVRFDRQLVTMETGVNPAYVVDDKAVTVDSMAISTLAQAWDAAARVAATVAGPQQTLSVHTTGVTRIGSDKHTGRYLTMDEFNTEYPGKSFDQFSGLWTGQTFQDFNDHYDELFSIDFETQAFGNIAGARVQIGDVMYRIRSVTITPNGIDYSAERDTMMEDFNTVWAGATFNDFNAAFAGVTFDIFSVMPLRRD
jgi:hypothetical protein